MTPAQSQTADNTAHSSVEHADAVGTESAVDAVDVMLVLKRTTLKSYTSTLQHKSRHTTGSGDVFFRAAVGPKNRIRLNIVSSQKAALNLLAELTPRAMLVEVEDHPHSRERFCKYLRRRCPHAALIAVGKLHSQGRALFDNALSLPLSTHHLVKMIQGLDHRSGSVELSCGSFHLDPTTRIAKTPGGCSALPPKLYALLELFMQRHGEVIGRGELMEMIWETSYVGDTRTLDVHVRMLRQHIEPDPSAPRYLLTERGKGYCLQVEAPQT